MDASTTVAEMTARATRTADFIRRERDSGRFYRYAAIGTAAILAAMIAFSVSVDSWRPKRPVKDALSAVNTVSLVEKNDTDC